MPWDTPPNCLQEIVLRGIHPAGAEHGQIVFEKLKIPLDFLWA
jgi:hypothetical protein